MRQNSEYAYVANKSTLNALKMKYQPAGNPQKIRVPDSKGKLLNLK